MFNTITGLPEPWTEQLLRWSSAVLMTPTPTERWGRREWALSRLGFTVLPLAPEGLAVLGELHGSEKPVIPPPSSAAGARPPRWIHEPRSMLLPTPPVGVTPGALCSELRKYLGPNVYVWLQACAVYPEIHWGMTLRIGASLLRSDRRLAEALPRLVRLPWLRDSYMPSWLREALVTDLSPRDWARTHQIIGSILDAAKGNASGDIPLHIAPLLLKPPWWRNLWRAIRPDLSVRPGRLHRDAVFLRFMHGPPQLSVPAVERIKRLFFREGLWSLGPRLAPVLTVAVAVTCLLAWRWPPVFIEQKVVEVPAAPPAVTAITMTGNVEAPVVVGYSNGEIWQVTKSRTEGLAISPSPAPSPLVGVKRFPYAEPRRVAVHMASGHTFLFAPEGESSDRWNHSQLPGPDEHEVVIGRDPDQRAYLSLDGALVRLTGPDNIKTYRTNGGPILCSAFNPETGALVTVSSNRVEVFDYRRGRIRDFQVAVAGCTAREKGEYVFGWKTREGRAPRIWRFSLRTLQVDAPFDLPTGAPIAEAAVSPDGRVLSVLRGTQLEIYDGTSGQAWGTIPSPANRMAVSPDGSSIALALAAGGIEVWKVRVKVLDTNRPPHIVAAIPTTQTLTVKPGETVRFSVLAEDPDRDDALAYVWSLDGARMAEGERFELKSGTPGARQRVEVAAVDRAGLSERRTWELAVEGGRRRAVAVAVAYIPDR